MVKVGMASTTLLPSPVKKPYEARKLVVTGSIQLYLDAVYKPI